MPRSKWLIFRTRRVHGEDFFVRVITRGKRKSLV